MKQFLQSSTSWSSSDTFGVVGCGEGVMYLTPSAYSWAMSAILEGKCFISSVSSLSFLFPFFSSPFLSSSLISHFSLSLGDETK